MSGWQGATTTDPVDQLVPPPRSRWWLVGLLIVTLLTLAVAALIPVSGAVRPNLVARDGVSGSALDGVGEWEYRIENRGWTTATIDSFDLGVPAVSVTGTTFLDDGGHAQAPPVTVAPGSAIRVRLRYTYDCSAFPSASRPPIGGGVVMVTDRPSGQDATVRARGVIPIWTTVHLGSGSYGGGPSYLVHFLAGSCDPPP